MEFTKSDIWSAILWELSDRESYLIDLYKANDPEWTAEIIRGKLTELDYIRQIPQSVIDSIALEKLQKQKLREDTNEMDATNAGEVSL